MYLRNFPVLRECPRAVYWGRFTCKHNLWRKKDTFGEQHTIAGSNCWLQSILEGPCWPSLSESESKDWGSQAILPPTNTHCKASVLSLGDTARSRLCSFSQRTKHGSFTKESSPSNLAKGGSVCSRKWLSGQCGTPCKTVKDSFIRTSLGPACGSNRVPLQPRLCSLSSERQVKTEQGAHARMMPRRTSISIHAKVTARTRRRHHVHHDSRGVWRRLPMRTIVQYYQEYIRTRVCNSILWGLSRQNSKFVIDDAQPLSFRLLCTQRRPEAPSFWLAFQARPALCMHVFVEVQCSTLGSTLEDKCFSFFSTDWRWQWWRTSNSAVTAFIAKRPRVAYSCSYVLLVLLVVHVQCIQLLFSQTLFDLKKSVSHSISPQTFRKDSCRIDQRDQVSKRAGREPLAEAACTMIHRM